MDILRGKACVKEFDVTAITETWIFLANKHFLPECEIVGYQMFQQDRKGKGGEGEALYVSNSLKYSINSSIKADADSESHLRSKGKN